MASIRNLIEAGVVPMNPAQTQLAEAAISRLETTATDIIARELKGSVLREFPGQLKDKTLPEIIKGAQSGVRHARRLTNYSRI